MARARPLALVLTVVTSAVLVGAVGLVIRWPDVDAVQVAVTAVLTLPALVVGLVVGLRRPTSPVGPLLGLQALAFATIFGWQGAYDEAAVRHPGQLPVFGWLVVLERGTWTFLFLPVGLMLLLFPTGRLIGPGWRWVAGGLVAVAVSFPAITAFSASPLPAPYQDLPHPFVTAPVWLRAVGWVELPLLLGLLAASAVSVVLRYRSCDEPRERAQIRWLALGAWALPVTLLLCWLSLLVLGTPDLGIIGLSAMAVSIPASVAVAMLRYQLYDVDRALSVTVTYSVHGALVLAVFTVTEIFVGVLLGRSSALVAAVATAVAALVLTPARRLVRSAADRRLDPMRIAVHQALAELRRDINIGTAQPEDLEPTLQRALRAPHLRVGYIAPGGNRLPATSVGQPVPTGVAVRLAQTQVGVIDPGPTPASKELLQEVADDASLLVEVARLRVSLTMAVAEVRRSRGRLLRHGYQERRTLERDLHDGAQQRLVALGMSLRLAQRHLKDDAFDVDGLLDQAMAQLGTAVAELRTIAAGLRPAALNSGLDSALRSLAATVPLPVELALCDDSNVPDDIATTAYYVVSEGLANAMKHAQARQVCVSLSRATDRLAVEVRDDGVGGALSAGSGLAGLADRVAAASGELQVVSPHGAGTRLTAVLPCGS